jgi:cytosine/adenosine deaminase-related metal-dependent hydrolase
LWESIGLWDEGVDSFDGGPVRYARALGLLEARALLAHVNYCDDDELEVLAAGKGSVLYCPRTHEYFGHPPHRWKEMLARGINVAVGTDSCASSPDLNLVDDLRLLHRIAPGVDPETLWQMATVRAAKAINKETSVGSLTAGKWADLVVFPAQGEAPLREILETRIGAAQVWIGGELITGSAPPALRG